MFSFLSSSSNVQEPVAPDASSGQGSLFGGLEVQQQATDEAPHNMSGFSFLAAGGESSVSSGFSFMLTPANSETATIAEVSGFSFLSAASDGPALTDAPSGGEIASAFSFLSSPSVAPANLPEPTPTLGQTGPTSAWEGHATVSATDNDQERENEIKLAKSSLNKQVKKKKRATKVGLGREDDDEAENASTGSAQQPQQALTPATQRANSISAIAVEETHATGAAAALSQLGSFAVSAGASQVSQVEVAPSAPVAVPAAAISTIPLNILAAMASAPTKPPAPQPTELSGTAADASDAPPPIPLPLQQSQPQPQPQPQTQMRSGIGVAEMNHGAPVDTVYPAVPMVGNAAQNAAAAAAAAVAQAPAPSSSIVSPSRVISMATHSIPPPAAPSPAPAETAVQKLERKSREALDQLVRGLADLSRLHTTALLGQQRFQQEVESESAALQAVRNRREETEQLQSRLAQEEDFEGAEALNAVLEQCTVEIRTRESTLRDLRSSVLLLESTFAQERADAVSGLARAASALKVAREQLELSATQMVRTADRQHASEQARIAAELERISLEKSHFEREEQALAADTERTEEAISSQTGDLSERKNALDSEVGKVDAEISALEAQLAAKRAEREQLSQELEVVEGKIGEVRKKYDRQLQRIADRKVALQASKGECLAEEAAVLRDQEAMNAQLQSDKTTAETVWAWTARLESDSSLFEALLANLNGSPRGTGTTGQMASLSALEAGPDSSASTEALRKNLEAIAFLLGKKGAGTVELQARRDALLQESRALGEQLSLLESEKRAHAAAKRFKEAAAVAKDLKDRQTTKEAVDSDLAAVEASIAHTQQEIEELERQQTAGKKQLAEAQRAKDIARFDRLVARAREVRSVQRSVLSGTGEARGELLHAVTGFLDTELAAVLREGRAVQEQYALPQGIEELIQDCEPSGTAASGAGESQGSDFGEAAEGQTALGAEEQPSAAAVASVASEPSTQGDVGEGKEETCDAADSPAPAEAEAETGADAAAQEGDGASAHAADRATIIGEAKDLVAEIAVLGRRMDEASDHEDYELAAELFETITTGNARLDLLLETLGCTRINIPDM